jgi:hypothetical protein
MKLELPMAKRAQYRAATHQVPRSSNDLGSVSKIRLVCFLSLPYNQIVFVDKRKGR